MFLTPAQGADPTDVCHTFLAQGSDLAPTPESFPPGSWRSNRGPTGPWRPCLLKGSIHYIVYNLTWLPAPGQYAMLCPVPRAGDKGGDNA